MSEQMQTELMNICGIIQTAVPAEQIYLFGSHAYGTPHADSDYDLCVVISDDSLLPVEAIKRIRRALYAEQSTPLDVIVCRANDFKNRQSMLSLERKIAQEGVLLYGQ